MASYDELMNAARKADSQGDSAAARRFLQLASEQRQQPAQGGSALDTYSDFGRGVTQGAVNVSRAGQKLLWRTTGALGFDGAQDMLDIVNAKNMDSEKLNRPYRDRSPLAFGVGEVVGETALTLPVGGAGAAVGKAAFNGTRAGITLARGGRVLPGAMSKPSAVGALAGEGAAVGGFMAQDGEVGQDAAAGAALNVAGGALINGVTRAVGEGVRTWSRTPRALNSVDDQLAAATRRVTQASEHGGYDLDGVDALSETRGFNARDEARRDPTVDRMFLTKQAQVEEQIAGRANEIAYKYSGGGAYEGPMTNYTQAQAALTELREADEKAYKAAYRKYDELAAQSNTLVDPQPLYRALDEAVFRPNAATETLAGAISKDLERYGIAAPPKGPVKRGVEYERRKSNPYFFPPTNQQEVVKPLTLENAEDLIQDLNAHWKPTLSTGEKALIGQVKGELEKYIDTVLTEVGQKAGQGEAVVTAAREARAARRAFSENWQRKDIIDLMTQRTEGGEYALDYSKVFTKLSAGDGHKDIAAIKARLMLAPNGQKAIRSMQQAPLLAALEAATKGGTEQVMEGGVIRFNHRKFEQVLNQQLKTNDAKIALWGKEGAEEIQKAIEAWGMRHKTPSLAGSRNKSGTVGQLLRQLRFLPSGKTRNVGMFVAGFSDNIGGRLQRGARLQAADDILLGKTVPQEVRDQMAGDLLEKWEEEFVGAGGQKYGDMLRQLIRTGAVVEFID